ncbi:hypothetical protein [Sporosarcina sp. 6E9]|uniref:hypothetical protein n=1 Tax=Sporosarcina sp. 6E9 TaxID=2819235 RepID=UPI001AC3B932|nr:hypothetical protein [Sporosarcina sp. 6E9]MBO1910641.1 hypothetical protein [Microvirga sp. 3-52]
MFGLSDLLALIISAFIILPVVSFIRESGYFIVGGIFGVKNPRLTIGSGPRLYKKWVFDIRKHYHLYSWFSYDELRNTSKLAYIAIYAAPILINMSLALTLNALLANGYLEEYKTFFDRFVFYAFYFVLFDIVPMFTINGKPNNGMILYEMIRYGKRTDFNNEPFIPSTTEVEEQYIAAMEAIKELEQEKELREQEFIEEMKELDKAKNKELKE